MCWLIYCNRQKDASNAGYIPSLVKCCRIIKACAKTYAHIKYIISQSS